MQNLRKARKYFLRHFIFPLIQAGFGYTCRKIHVKMFALGRPTIVARLRLKSFMCGKSTRLARNNIAFQPDLNYLNSLLTSSLDRRFRAKIRVRRCQNGEINNNVPETSSDIRRYRASRYIYFIFL